MRVLLVEYSTLREMVMFGVVIRSHHRLTATSFLHLRPQFQFRSKSLFPSSHLASYCFSFQKFMTGL
jgi:hypothetical protein